MPRPKTGMDRKPFRRTGNPFFAPNVWEICTYIYHTFKPRIGKYSIHGASGEEFVGGFTVSLKYSPCKNDAWKMNFPFCAANGLFSKGFCVSFREGIYLHTDSNKQDFKLEAYGGVAFFLYFFCYFCSLPNVGFLHFTPA